MDYKISNICHDLSIGKSTIYKRIEFLKKEIPKSDWKNNDYFYYTDNNKLFITEKGFNFIKNFKNKNDNISNSSIKDITIYQNQIIEIYQKRIEFLENENKKLLDIIAFKEQKELSKDIKQIQSNEKLSFFSTFLKKFQK